MCVQPFKILKKRNRLQRDYPNDLLFVYFNIFVIESKDLQQWNWVYSDMLMLLQAYIHYATNSASFFQTAKNNPHLILIQIQFKSLNFKHSPRLNQTKKEKMNSPENFRQTDHLT